MTRIIKTQDENADLTQVKNEITKPTKKVKVKKDKNYKFLKEFIQFLKKVETKINNDFTYTIPNNDRAYIFEMYFSINYLGMGSIIKLNSFITHYNFLNNTFYSLYITANEKNLLIHVLP